MGVCIEFAGRGGAMVQASYFTIVRLVGESCRRLSVTVEERGNNRVFYSALGGLWEGRVK